MKNSSDTIGNRTLIAQCLNQLSHRVPPSNIISHLISRRYFTAYCTGGSYIHTENWGLISSIGVFPTGCATLQKTQPFLQYGFESHRDDTLPVTPLSSASMRTSERTQFLSTSTTRLQSNGNDVDRRVTQYLAQSQRHYVRQIL